MIISFKHKYIFIKNRKVAGSSIQYILKKYLFDFDKDISSLFKLHDHELEKSNEFDKKYLDNINIDSSFNQHASLIDICDYLKINLREARKFFFIFCIERNSYDKAVSSYEFSRKKKKPDGTLKCPYLNNFRDMFDYPKLIPSDWNNYSNNNQISVDYIYQFDQLSNLIHDLNKRFNNIIPDQELSKIKLKSGYRDFNQYQRYFTNETKNAVNYFFQKEIQYFNYKF